ncbi:MAG: NAD(P)H-hydrate dehydratase [Gammaproteobacteria bacterium]|nr:NAD(P)H-hydrate dehydratase [Gammaproteobacteria bacterium]
MTSLPRQLYTASATRQLDQLAIKDHNIPGYSLMYQAGEAVFQVLQQSFPLAKRLLVCCGAGNNGGDGYVIARLAQQAGLDVKLVSLVDIDCLSGDAAQACKDWRSLGHQPVTFSASLLKNTDVVIDALLGTGLDREVTGEWRQLIELINQSAVPVIAVDVPSGLSADTGSLFGIAVQADITVSFIGLNRGLLTHQGPDYTGQIMFYDLGVPASVYQSVSEEARLLNWDDIKQQLQPRPKNSHKHNFGHLLVVGGDHGMAGAVRLAAEAALRTGAGLVTVITRPEHVAMITAGCPELMVTGTETGQIPHHIMNNVQAIVIGPGLGRGDWGMNLLSQVLQSGVAKLLDADALNLLGPDDGVQQDWVLTPHPGEAAHLLATKSADIQHDRFLAIEQLAQTYGGTIILKGCGSLVKSGHEVPAICPYGNPGMATAGMGDVLSGIIGALMAQGFSQSDAARLGVCIHALAGDRAAGLAPRGLIAADLFVEIRKLVNPD